MHHWVVDLTFTRGIAIANVRSVCPLHQRKRWDRSASGVEVSVESPNIESSKRDVSTEYEWGRVQVHQERSKNVAIKRLTVSLQHGSSSTVPSVDINQNDSSNVFEMHNAKEFEPGTIWSSSWQDTQKRTNVISRKCPCEFYNQTT